MYYLLLPDLEARTRFMDAMRASGISTVFHYIPLHSAPQGLSSARTSGALEVTDRVSSQLVRLPLWLGLEDRMDEVLESADAALAAVE